MDPKQARYTKSHEYAMVEDDLITIGITDHAQRELGDVIFVEMPDIGADVEVGEQFGSIESVKAFSELYSPVNGEVVEVNELLADAPETVNSSPFDAGWMIRVKPTDDPGLEDLMDAEEYAEYVDEES